MSEIMRNRPSVLSSAAPFCMHKDSQTISKVKPKIRIIHIFAPEIIKTDVANFRELVQRLTGKPTEKVCKKKPRRPYRREDHQPRPTNWDTDNKPVNKNMEQRRERVKEEENTWNGAHSDGYLGGFEDLDGFIQELSEFPMLLPMDANHIHVSEETRSYQMT